MIPSRKQMILLLLLLGLVSFAVGIIFTPAIAAKYWKHVETLNHDQTMKVVTYQVYAIVAGSMMMLVSISMINTYYGMALFFPLLWAAFMSIDSAYIDKIYPDNILFQPDGFSKTWDILLGKQIILSDYTPKSALVVDHRKIRKAKYPAIDVHFHLKSLKNYNAEELIKVMDSCGVKKIINLDGGPGDLETYTRDFKEKYPERFEMFVVLNLHEFNKADFITTQLALLEKAVKTGARGIKVYKSLGLNLRKPSGELVSVDDPRLDPIWEKAGESGIPVLIHLGDPTPFFAPVDRFNERLEELLEFPEWSFYGPQFPKKETLRFQFENLLRKHPKTVFIGAHMGDYPENLASLADLLDRHKNYHVDVSSRLPELGRQPFTARKFFIKYQDRILFGTDGGYALAPDGLWSAERYFQTYFEFLETDNEYFEYPLWGINKQGRWRIYGIDLPDSVLEKIYHKNAEKILANISGKIGRNPMKAPNPEMATRN